MIWKKMRYVSDYNSYMKQPYVINFLGDSITEGIGADCPENVYSTVCCRLAKAKEGNYGLSGSRIAKQRVNAKNNPDEEFILRARWMNPCDFLFVFGGTNDFGHGDAELGQMGDTTRWTFYGALHELIQYLLTKKGLRREQICFIIPTPRQDEDSVYGDGCKCWKEFPVLEEYRDAIRRECDAFGIDYFESKLPAPPKGFEGPSEFFVDGLHPSTKGHIQLGTELYEYLKKKGLAE